MASRSMRIPLDQPKPHFMHSTEASRAQKASNGTHLHYFDDAQAESVVAAPQRGQFIRRATHRITSLGANKRRESKVGKSRLNISSPVLQYSTIPSSNRLPSPSAKTSTLPDPVKREPLDSPTATDKPLPSLPVATVVSRSPFQRRSLIDATERPLRKSLSPHVIQDWPTLLPDITNSKMCPSETSCTEKKNITSSIQKPSMSESVIERMRKLNLNSTKFKDGDDQSEEENAHENRKVISTPRNENTVDNIIARSSSFLCPREAPLTPGNTNGGPSKGAEAEGLAASQGREVFKVYQSPCHDENTPESMSKDLRSDHAKSIPVSSGSSIPRLSKAAAGTDSGDISFVGYTPSSLQLRRTRVRIGDDSSDSPLLKSGQKHIDNFGKGLGSFADRASVIHRQSSLPLPERLTRHNRVETKPSQIGISVLESKAQTEADCSHSLHSSSASETTTKEHVPDSPIGIPKQSQSILNDKADGNQSVVSRSRSMSTATSGTIYAYDEFGSYRLKPVSISDRKNGPRVRIDDAADSLLLDDENLAKCDAKREAYQNRYNVSLLATNSGQPPDMQLTRQHRSAEKFPTLEAGKMEHNGVSPFRSSPNKVNVEIKSDGKASAPNKLAPPIAVNIPALSHSSTGWPLLVSRVAPFADVGSNNDISKSRAKRKSASDSDLRSASPTPTATPAKHIETSVEQSPASAYTLRTALNNSLFGSTAQRPHRSVRSTPMTSDHDSPLTRRTTGLRKTSGGLNKSYTSQRAAFKSSPPVPDVAEINYAAQVQSILSSTPTHLGRKQKSNIRDTNAHEVKTTDSSSSTPASSGSVSTGKGVMSNIKGLFHKQSNDRVVKSASNSSLRMKRRTSIRTPSAAFKPSPLRTTVNPNTPDTVASAREAAANSTTKRKFAILHRDRNIDHISSAMRNDAKENLESASPQPFVTSALEPFEIRDATNLAFTLLDKARDSMDPDIQQDYIELAKLLVATVGLSREAEKAMEEAQQAAARAEMEAIKTRRSITEIVEKTQGMLDKQTDI